MLCLYFEWLKTNHNSFEVFETIKPVVRDIGLEPIRCHHRGILSPLRLPIPPIPRMGFKIKFQYRYRIS